MTSGFVIDGFKENSLSGAIHGAKKALPDEEIIRILKSAGITSLVVAAGGILGAGVEIGAQALKMSILAKSLLHVAVGTGIGGGAEYLHTGTVSVQGVVFAFVLSAVGQVIAITKIGTMNNDKVSFDKQVIKQAYQDLGLADDVVLTKKVLKDAYRKMSLLTHPDKPGGSDDAFIKMQMAYQLLSKSIQPTIISEEIAPGIQNSKSYPATISGLNQNFPTVIGDTSPSINIFIL